MDLEQSSPISPVGVKSKQCRYSILIPVHNEQENLAPLLQRLGKVLETLPGRAEILFVNDGSTDETALRLRSARKADDRIRVLHFSRNFGHQLAITAALDHANGEACIIMDGDLQDPPELIPELVAKWREGFDVVYAVRHERRGDTFFKRMTAHLFYRFLRTMTEVPIPADTGDFRLIDRKVVLALRELRERGRFLRGMVNWVGFRQAAVPLVRESRVAGSTKYSLRRMLRFALDAVTSFSMVPLQMATSLGVFFSVSAFLCMVYVFYAHYVMGKTVTGWSSLMTITLFFGGVQLLFLGVLGEYIGRIFEEVKKRPLYIISEREGFQEND